MLSLSGLCLVFCPFVIYLLIVNYPYPKGNPNFDVFDLVSVAVTKHKITSLDTDI